MVAIPTMNDTHLEETLIINKLETACTKFEVEAIPDILQELIDHTTTHFLNEEEMMKQSNFSGLEDHKRDHDRHLHELKALVKYFDKNRDPKAISAYIEGGLTRWMIHHVETMDTQAATFIQENDS